MHEPKFLTIEQARKQFRVSRNTLYEWMNEGRLTRYRKPNNKRDVFLSEDELNRIIKENDSYIPEPKNYRAS